VKVGVDISLLTKWCLMKLIIRIVLSGLISVPFVCLAIQPEKVLFREITFEMGLPFNKCHAIHHDHKGFIWFGSDVGLHRYDGNDFRSFSHDQDDNNSLREGKVNAIYADSQNNLWVGTSTGVDRYCENENQFVRVPMTYEPTGVFDEPVLGFFENDRNELFLHCHFSISQYNPGLSQFERIITGFREIDQIDCVIESLIEDNGYFILGTSSKGLVIFHTQKNAIKWFGKDQIGSSTVSEVFKSRHGQIWLATDNGVRMVKHRDDFFEGQDNCFIAIGHTLGARFNSLSEDQHGYIWASSDGKGIFKIDPHTLATVIYQQDGDNGSILNNKTAFIHIDPQDNLWAFFGNYGFNVTNLNYKSIFNTYTRNSKNDNSLSGDIITSFAQDNRGNIWIGTDGDGLNYYDVESGKFQHFFADPSDPSGLSSNIILSLFIDSDEKLWIGTYDGGLNCYDPNTRRFRSFKSGENHPNTISGNDVTSILEDDNGNLIVLTNGNGLNFMDRRTGTFTLLDNDIQDVKKLSHNGGTALFKDHAGNIWIGTYYGLNRMDAQTRDISKYFHDPDNHESIISNTIHCIYEDMPGRIWVGTNKGLSMLEGNKGRFKSFTTKQGLPDNQINSIIEDNYGFLWVGTNRGISKIHPHSFEIKNYGENHHLPGYMLVPRSVMKSSNGNLYFGGNRGFTMFDPIQRNIVVENPPLFFTDFKIFDRSIKPNEEINGKAILTNDISNTDFIAIQHIHKSFSFTFSSLDYARIAKPDLFYMMEGFDNQWRKIVFPDRTINYTNLDPGTYTFKVKSVPTEGETDHTTIEMRMVILPPWWKTWWAYLSYFVVFLSVTILVVYFVVNRLKLRHNYLIEKNQKEREIEIGRIKDNFYTSITHEFRTPLTLVLGPLESIIQKYKDDHYLSNHIQLMKKNTTRLLVLINEMLDFKKLEADALQLNVSESNFSEFFFQIAENFKLYAHTRKISFLIDIEDKHVQLWFDRIRLERAFYNLLSNAVKYTPEKGTIRCSLQKMDDNYVSVKIVDSGIGIPKNEIGDVFKKYYSALNAKGYESTGLGLYLTKEIIELHKGTIHVVNNEAAGASFEVILKLGKTHFDKASLSDNQTPHTSFDSEFSRPDIVPEINGKIDRQGYEHKTPSCDKPVILVVEDNHDVRSFLTSELGERYRLLEAANGAQGLEMAQNQIPDLIITDIMMPIMDGRNLCSILKHDVRTSHIPIIMLTALSDIENRITGLEMGADSYISKPYHPKHLNVRIEKLLNLRKTLQKKYSLQIEQAHQTFSYTAGKVEKLSADELFLQRLVKAIEGNISDSNYQLDDLCSDMGMNYLQLYRKVKAVTNLSIKQFILTIKMRNAAKMLESGKFNISEVAYDVGFSSPAYFSETFKKHFSLTPTEYTRKMS
jgi:signal transduction histidine kinase/ligand-binding sensor domain-containing protein/DNA-binding response OmpR family regulator